METEKKIKSNNKNSFNKSNTAKALIIFSESRNNKSLKDLRGKIEFREDYDYKSMRK